MLKVVGDLSCTEAFGKEFKILENLDRSLCTVTTAPMRCCAMNTISHFEGIVYKTPQQRKIVWAEIKALLKNPDLFRYEGYGGFPGLVNESSWQTKTFFIACALEKSAHVDHHFYNFIVEDPDCQLIHSFTNHAHDRHQVGLFKLEFK